MVVVTLDLCHSLVNARSLMLEVRLFHNSLCQQSTEYIALIVTQKSVTVTIIVMKRRQHYRLDPTRSISITVFICERTCWAIVQLHVGIQYHE